MTIQTTNNTTQTIQTLGGNQVFLYDYRMDLASDSIVTIDGVNETGYSILGLGDDAGGSVTLLTAPAVGAIIVVARIVPETQNVSYPVRGAFPAPSHENAMDRITMMVQQQNEKTERGLRFPLGDTADPALADVTVRKDRFMAFGPDGEITYPLGVTTDAQLRADLANPVNGDSLIAGQKSTGNAFTLHDYHKNRTINVVTDFGAVGDGITDDRQAIQAAVDSLPAYGGIVWFPAGDYLMDTTSASLVVPEGVVLQGVAIYEPTGPETRTTGSTFYITAATYSNPAITIDQGCSIIGINFWYPDQDKTELVPTRTYDYTIRFNTTINHVQGITIKECIFYNSYKAIDMSGSGTFQPGSTFIHHNRFFALNTGIRLGNIRVNVWVHNNLWSPELWTESVGQNVRIYAQENCTAMLFEDGDNLYFQSNSIFQVNHGIELNNNSGIFMNITGNVIDGTRQCIYCKGGGAIQGGVISNNSFAGSLLDQSDFSANSIHLDNMTVHSKLLINNNYFSPTQGNHITIASAAPGVDHFVVTGNTFEWMGKSDLSATTYRGISINAQNSILLASNNKFIGGFSTRVNDFGIKLFACDRAVITGNDFYNFETCVDATVANSVIIKNNTSLQSDQSSVLIGQSVVEAIHSNNLWDNVPGGGKTLPSASALILNFLYDTYRISGTTTITSITGGELFERTITLIFDDVLTFTDGLNIKLSGDFITSTDDTITLKYDGTNWYELSRSVN